MNRPEDSVNAFISGDVKETIRRNMELSRDKQQPEDYDRENWTENATSSTPPDSPLLTTPLPTLSKEDVNITMLCEDFSVFVTTAVRCFKTAVRTLTSSVPHPGNQQKK